MTVRRLLVVSGLCAALLTGLVLARASAPASKAIRADTEAQPPVLLLAAWLDAFNSGDPQRYAVFLNRTFPFRWPAYNDDLALRQRTGGYDLRELKRLSGVQVTGSLEERRSGQPVAFELTLELYVQADSSGTPPAARPYRIAALDLVGGSAPPRFCPLPLSGDMKELYVINAVMGPVFRAILALAATAGAPGWAASAGEAVSGCVSR